MKTKKLLALAAMAAMTLVPLGANAQEAESEPVVINGSLINWYYYGKDMHSSDIGWQQQPTGGGAWIDEEGVAHADGAPNYGLLGLTLNPNSAKKPILPAFQIRNTVLYSNCGGVYMGGNEYYSFFGHEVDAPSNIDGELGSEEYEIWVRKWTWDVNEDGSYHNIKYQQVGKLSNQPTDLTYDPLNDIVYGVFSVSNGEGTTGYKLGILDMETFKVTKWISREATQMGGELRTLACDKNGDLYGTDASGNIYYVSKADGTTIKIGELLDENGNKIKSRLDMMSATIDFRTNKMYWLGFMNNGKNNDTAGTNSSLTVAEGGRDTGLYEITLNGLATTAKLIGRTNFKDIEIEYDEDGVTPIGAKENEYGKLQMTGLYVEGSIVKYAKDLRIMLTSAPTQLMPGEAGKVTVNVKNIGTEKVLAKSYKVDLYVGGEKVATIDRDSEPDPVDNLEAGQSQTLTFDFTAPAKSGLLEIRVEVVYADDERQANNVAGEYAQVLTGKTLPTPVLSGEYNDSDESVILTWTKPDGHVLEGAEEFMPFTYEGLNDWMMVDGDGFYTQKFNNWNSTVDFDNWNTPKAFIVMNPYLAGLSPDVMIGGEKFLPHSGSQYFAAFHSADPATKTWGANDDYMVSPELNGDAQTISFWAKSYRGYEATGYETEAQCKETLEVLYTTQEIDKENLLTQLKDGTTFQVAVSTFEVNDRAWEQYTAELPAGAKYFALHRNTGADDAFVMLIDDIEFNIAAQEPTAYRLYVNNQYQGEQAADVTSVKATGVDIKNEYYVTAVYGTQESAPSNTWSVAIEESGDLVKGPDVYEIWMIDIENAKSSYWVNLDNGGTTDGNGFYNHTAEFTEPICVGFDGTDIYIKGLSLDKPNAWIKGQLTDNTATFPAGQFIGHDSYMSAQSQNATSDNDPVRPIVFAYDKESKTLTLDASLGIIENNNTANISGVYAYWDKLVLYKYNQDAGIEDVAVKDAHAVVAFYNLNGQKVNANAKGLLLRQVRQADGTFKTIKVLKK